MSSHPTLAIATDGRAMAVWEEGGALWFSRRSGNSWSAPAPIPSAEGAAPRLAADPAGGLDLVWSAYSALADNFEVYHCRWSAGRWSLPVNVSDSPGESLEPDITVHPSRGRLIAWAELDETGVAEVHAATSVDGRAWASGPVTGADGQSPRVAAGTGDIAWHLAWLASPGGAEPVALLYSERAAEGAWTLPELVSGPGEPAVDAQDLWAGAGRPPTVAWRSGGGPDRGGSIRLARRLPAGWSSRLVAVAPTIGAPALDQATDGTDLVAFTLGDFLHLGRSLDGAEAVLSTLGRLAGGARNAALAAGAPGAEGLVLAEGGAAGEADIFALGLDGAAPTPGPDTPTPGAATPSATVTGLPPGSPTPTAPTPTTPTPGTPSPTAPSPTTPSPTATGGSQLTAVFLPWAWARRPR